MAEEVQEADIAKVWERIDRLHDVAVRWGRPGGSPRLAQRALDQAAGMETALRLLTGRTP